MKALTAAGVVALAVLFAVMVYGWERGNVAADPRWSDTDTTLPRSLP